MIFNILLWLGVTVVSSALYHISGIGGFRGAKLLRRLGCPLITLILYLTLAGLKLSHIWAYVVFWWLNYGALSTYHDYLAPDGSSENWLCWLMTGFCYAISAFPLCIVSGKWLGFILRTVILTLGVMLVREKSDSPAVEELGSGFLYTCTIPLLLI